jgi:uncharacterized lipoprotein YddW (UPF0748 family)
MRGFLALAAAALLTACVGDVATPPAGDDAPDAGAPDAGPDEPAGELRGVWITRFAYTTQAELEAIIDRAAAARFNAVFVQIRGNGDAYYDSALEPWAQRLTGVLGRDPGWDPLQVAIDRARQHGIEIHAYFNVFPGWTATGAVPAAEGTRQLALRDHPEWLAIDSSGTNRDGEYRWISPGNPAARAHIAAVARDLLGRYDVDGLHLDRIRTAGTDYSRDAVSVAAFDAASDDDPSLTWGDFMRDQVSEMVAELYAVIGETQPDVRLSASVWGIYQPLPGCNTSQGYGGYYQDSIAWMQRQHIDAIVPMMYWPIEDGACTDWATLLDGFLEERGGRHVWAGMHALDEIDGADGWDFDQIRARIDYARAAEAQGTVVFASTYLDADLTRWSDYPGTDAAPGPFFEPAGTPAMPWKP